MHNIFYLDVFSEDTSFIIQGKRNFRSCLGVFLSIGVLIASVILIIMFGQEVYQRKHPTVSISEEFLTNSRIEMVDFPLYIVISDFKGNKIENVQDYYDIKSYKMNFTADGHSDYAGYAPFHPVVKCERKHFSKVKGKISDDEIDQILESPSFCVEYDDQGIVQNPYKSKNSTFLDIDVSICDRFARTCGTDINDIIKEAYVQIYLLNSYIDSLDFSNPVKYYYQSITTQITNTYLKRNYINLINNEYISDDGWILEESRLITYYSLGTIESEVNSMTTNDPLSVLWNTLQSPYLRTKTMRDYLKIQDLFAKIGGIVNAFMIIINTVFTHYFRYNFNMNLRQHLNPSDKDYKERRTLNLLNINKSSTNNLNNFIYSNLLNKISTNNLDGFKEKSNKEKNQKNQENQENVDNNENHVYTHSQKYSDKQKQMLYNNFIKPKSNILDNSNYNESFSKSSVQLKEFKSESNKDNSVKNMKDLRYLKNLNNDNEGNKNVMKLKIKVSKESNFQKDHINSSNDSNVSDSSKISSFNFDYIDFRRLTYFKYIYYKLSCSKKGKVYETIKNEIEQLLDFYVYCNYLKHQYLLKDPRELRE